MHAWALPHSAFSSGPRAAAWHRLAAGMRPGLSLRRPGPAAMPYDVAYIGEGMGAHRSLHACIYMRGSAHIYRLRVSGWCSRGCAASLRPLRTHTRCCRACQCALGQFSIPGARLCLPGRREECVIGEGATPPYPLATVTPFFHCKGFGSSGGMPSAISRSSHVQNTSKPLCGMTVPYHSINSLLLLLLMLLFYAFLSPNPTRCCNGT